MSYSLPLLSKVDEVADTAERGRGEDVAEGSCASQYVF
jgi:hypothetical protein